MRDKLSEIKKQLKRQMNEFNVNDMGTTMDNFTSLFAAKKKDVDFKLTSLYSYNIFDNP